MFLLPIIAATFLRIYLIIRDSVPFAYDMGRDLLWAKDIAFYHIPTLIGPAASIWGVYFGPFWFYFLSIPLFLAGGNPLSAVYVTATTIIATGFLSFILFKKFLPKIYAFSLLVVILFSATLINISTFAFHANVLPLLTLSAIYFGFLAVVKNLLFLSLSFLSVSLMFHADPAPAVVFTSVPIFTLFYFKLYKTKKLQKLFILSGLGYFVPFTPQILFEIRHNFLETKSLVAYFLGQNPSLSGQLPLFERITNRLSLYFAFFKSSFAGQSNIFTIVFLIVFILGIYKFLKINKPKNFSILFLINVYTIILSFLIFTFLITVEVKTWYLYGLTIPMSTLLIFAIYTLFHQTKYSKVSITSFLSFYILINLLPFFKTERMINSKVDPAQLANQLKAVNLIYDDAQNKEFSVYTFTPSIYDHNYQYLFWWQGEKLKRGLPGDFAYLPNQPDYIRNKNIYVKTTKLSNIIYLIIENSKENEFYTKAAWLATFKDFNLIWEKEISSAIKIQKRTK